MAGKKPRGPTPPKADRLKWVPRFLKMLADTANVRASCEAAKVSRAVVYRHRTAVKDFRAAWDQAIESAVDLLEYVARQRATRATDPSDTLLIFLLKAHRPAKYIDRLRLEVTNDEVRAESDRVAAELGLNKDEVWEEAQRIMAAGKGGGY